MHIKRFTAFILMNLLLGLVACSSSLVPIPTFTPTLPPTHTLVPTSTFTASPTVTPSTTPTTTPTVTPEPTPMGGGGQLVFVWNSFEYAAEGMTNATLIKIPGKPGYDGKDYPGIQGKMNIFISDPDGTNPIPLTTDGMEGYIYLRDVSPGGKKILVFSYNPTGSIPSFNSLYMVDLTGTEPEPQRITRYATGGIAKWIDNEKIVFRVMVGGVDGLYLWNLNGEDPLLLTKGGRPLYVLSIGDGGVYWVDYKDVSTAIGLGADPTGIWWSSMDGTVQKQIVKFDDHFPNVNGVSPDGAKVVWTYWNKALDKFINLTLLDDINNFASIPAPFVFDYFEPIWSPDGSKIFYKGSSNQATYSYILDLKTCAFIALTPLPIQDDGFRERIQTATWSPDSQRIIMDIYLNRTYAKLSD